MSCWVGAASEVCVGWCTLLVFVEQVWPAATVEEGTIVLSSMSLQQLHVFTAFWACVTVTTIRRLRKAPKSSVNPVLQSASGHHVSFAKRYLPSGSKQQDAARHR
jgi:hypothetical protein